MLKAADIMSKEVISVPPDMEVTEAAKLMLEKGINGLPVLEDGKLVGILCQSDLVAQQKKLQLPTIFTFMDGYIPLSSLKSLEKEVGRISALTVEQAMTLKPVTVKADTPLDEVATIMVDRGFHTLPVVEGGQVVGIIGKEDILKTVISGQ